MNRRSFPFALLLSLAACTEKPPEPGSAGPIEAVQSFADALSEGHGAAAWSMLSLRTQQAADALAEKARAASGSQRPESGRQMLFGSALPGSKVTARELSTDGGFTEVEVTDAQKHTRIYRAVREYGLWKVDLDLGAK